LVEQWLKQHPDDTVAGMVLAESLTASGQTSQAIAHYEKLARDERPNAMVLNNLAWLYHETGDARAEAIAKKAYDAAPRNGAIADTYGWILVQGGKAPDGLPILEQAVKDANSAPEIQYHYAVALANAGHKDKAKDELRILTRLGQGFPSAQKVQKLLSDLGG
jgi:Tfp pilus assembly protein PilF